MKGGNWLPTKVGQKLHRCLSGDGFWSSSALIPLNPYRQIYSLKGLSELSWHRVAVLVLLTHTHIYIYKSCISGNFPRTGRNSPQIHNQEESVGTFTRDYKDLTLVSCHIVSILKLNPRLYENTVDFITDFLRNESSFHDYKLLYLLCELCFIEKHRFT